MSAVFDHNATIHTTRLVLHPLRLEHADEMHDVLQGEQLHEFIGGHPLTLPELRLRYRRLATGRSPDGKERWLNWIIRVRAEDAAVGTEQATITGTHAQLAWVVGIPWQRQGIASEATAALVEWLEQHGVRSISANIHPGHTASQRVASRAGLQLTHDIIDGEQVWRRVSSVDLRGPSDHGSDTLAARIAR